MPTDWQGVTVLVTVISLLLSVGRAEELAPLHWLSVRSYTRSKPHTLGSSCLGAGAEDGDRPDAHHEN